MLFDIFIALLLLALFAFLIYVYFKRKMNVLQKDAKIAIDQHQKMSSKYRALIAQVTELEDKAAKNKEITKKQKSDLEYNIHELDKHKKQIDTLLAKIKLLEDYKVKFEEKSSSLNEANSSLILAESNKKQLLNKERDLTKQNSKFKAEISDLKGLKVKYQKAKTDLLEFENENIKLKSDLGSKTKSHSTNLDELKQVKLQLQESDDLIVQFTDQISDLNSIKDKYNQLVPENQTQISLLSETKSKLEIAKEAIRHLENQIAETKETNQAYKGNIETLNLIKEEKNQLLVEKEDVKQQVYRLQAQITERDTRINKHQYVLTDFSSKLSKWKEKFAVVEAENEILKANSNNLEMALEECKKSKIKQAPTTVSPIKSDDKFQAIRERAASINFDRIGISSESDKDNLQKIKGIGPFLEKKLNALGIFTFKQISNFTSEDEATVNTAIEFFPGRIKRDNWKDQASKLNNESK